MCFYRSLYLLYLFYYNNIGHSSFSWKASFTILRKRPIVHLTDEKETEL